MRILFDKNVPQQIRRSLAHQVKTAAQLEWDKLKNGALLKAAESAGFDVMVTSDQNLTCQQNLKGRRIALIVLGNGNWPVIQDHLSKIVAAVDAAKPSSYQFIEMPLPPKRKYKAKPDA